MAYTDTELWRQTLGSSLSGELEAAALRRLLSSFEQMRERAGLIAGDISHDLPDYTIHNISHLDALWEVGDMLGAADLDLNPLAGYLLGGAFLTHDLAMALAAWPGRDGELRQRSEWGDTVSRLYRDRLGRIPGPEEIQNPPEEISRVATHSLLRELHAPKAASLCTQAWEPREGQRDPYYLIDDRDLRESFGLLIGKIAASHWENIEDLPAAVGDIQVGAPAWCPSTWSIDPLMLACVLRLADIAHIDSRRAPGFLRAIRAPISRDATDHWIFQERLGHPQRNDDRVRYTSLRPFQVSEAASWWVLADYLLAIDRELRQVDLLLADNERPRLPARRVEGVSSPASLSNYIPTNGWTPLSAQPWIPDSLHVMAELGGEGLYGKNRRVPLRELLQNAIDASRARSAMEGRSLEDLNIVVELDDEEQVLSVHDSGIGMTREALINGLLGFGTSYWSSELCRRENPGLLAQGFAPAGKYGIGFFSVFMVASYVKVCTRRYDEGPRDTLVLEFIEGIERRPLLRPAQPNERLAEPGTRIMCRLKDPVKSTEGVLGFGRVVPWSIADLCAFLAPTSPVTICTRDGSGDDPTIAVAGGDWLTIPAEDLIGRLLLDIEFERFFWLTARDQGQFGRWCAAIAANVRTISVGDQLVGRATAVPTSIMFHDAGYRIDIERFVGSMVCGGTRMDVSPTGIAGVLEGRPARASRDLAVPVGEPGDYSQWASEQLRLASETQSRLEALEVTAILQALKADVSDCPVAVSGTNNDMTINDVVDLALDQGQLILADDGYLAEDADGGIYVIDFNRGDRYDLAPGVVFVNMDLLNIVERWPHDFVTDASRAWTFDEWWTNSENTLFGKILEGIAVAANRPFEEMLVGSGWRFGEISRSPGDILVPFERVPIGTRSPDGGDYLDIATRVRVNV